MNIRTKVEFPITAFQHGTVVHGRSTAEQNNDPVVTEVQANWMAGMSKDLAKQFKDFERDGNKDVFNPKDAIDNMKKAIQDVEGMEQELKIAYMETLDELKDDKDFINVLNAFQEGLEGERDLSTIGEFCMF